MADSMKWTSIPTGTYDSVYRSGYWELHHRIAGFGIVLVEVFHAGEKRRDFTGHNALRDAQQWCQEHDSRPGTRRDAA